MEILMTRADISKDTEATMFRFMGGLNRHIQDTLEMQNYDDLEEMLHKAIMVEQQLKRKESSRSGYGFGPIKKTVLVPMTPKEVHQYQLQLKNRKESKDKSMDTKSKSNNFYAKAASRGEESVADHLGSRRSHRSMEYTWRQPMIKAQGRSM
ncbi:hypothetical protein N665_0339s0028 [Sinapis alba]|nr:hypothetical protein N665_0339s0028 [Sinapis alba]